MKLKLALGMAALMVAVGAADCFAQGGRGNRGGRGMFNSPEMRQFFQEMGNMRLLQQESVMKDLGLDEEQAEQFKQLAEDVQTEMRETMRGFRDMSEEERVEEMKSFAGDLRAEVDKILLPHQRKRYKQLSLQSSMRGGFGRTGGAMSITNNKALMEELGITEEQIEAMKKKSEEVTKEINEKIARIRAEGQKEVFGVLKKDQQKKLEEMIGESFDFNSLQRGGFGRGGNQRGRGGRNGGGGGRDGGDGGR